jgi:hypothetical protein
MDHIGMPLPARTAILNGTDTIEKDTCGHRANYRDKRPRCPQRMVQGQPVSKPGASGVSFGSACSGLS